jgi:hypothetical protein
MISRFHSAIKFRHISVTLAAVAALLVGSAAVEAAPINLVKNGDFSLSSAGNGQIGYNTVLSDWSTSGYNFVFAEGTADTTGAMSWFGNSLTLWGSHNGGANALATSHDGGNFVANDGAYGVAALSQMITGLNIGQKYELTFEWAAAQQFGFTGATTEYWVANLGDDAATRQATAIYSNASHGSSAWSKVSMIFTATGTSELLSFLAGGTPVGEPPFSLLDGVSLLELPTPATDIAEPGSWLLMASGLGLLALLARRRRPDAA